VRGCLSVLVLAAVFLGIALWFGGPTVASVAVRTALTGSGLLAETLDVTVEADPPLTLAFGRASRVTIAATGVTWNDLHVATLDMTLDTVNLVARTAASVEGRLAGVQLSGGSEPAPVDVDVSGQADAARTTITIGRDAFTAMAIGAFEATFRVRPSTATLIEPDIVRVSLGGLTIDGHLAVAADGSIVTVANGLTVTLMPVDPSFPVHLTGLSVVGGDLRLSGTLDVVSLLR
jgi:hypothetical protein